MARIFSFIILLAVCHCSYSYRTKSSEESNSEEKLHTNVEPYKQKKSGVEKKPPYKEQAQYPRGEFRFKIENSKFREETPYKEKDNRPTYTPQNKNTAPKRALESSEHKDKEKEKIWRFELDLPEILRTLKKYTGVAISDAMQKKTNFNEMGTSREKSLRSSVDGIFGQKIRVEMKPPNVASLVGYLQELFSSGSETRRDYFPNRWVEETPGVIKSQAGPYPAYQEAGQLQALLEIKKKRAQKEEEERQRREEEANFNTN